MKYKNISISDAKKLIQEEEPMILDCRATGDYKLGHIENAAINNAIY